MSVRRLIFAFLCALVCVVPLMTGVASGQPGSDNVSHFCKSVDDMGQTHGGCVASLTTGNIVPNIANFCRDPVVRAEAAELAGREEVNHGQCVQILKDFFGV
jgi:hypothetical protein